MEAQCFCFVLDHHHISPFIGTPHRGLYVLCNNSSVWVCLFSLSFHFSRPKFLLANWRRLIREWTARSALTFQSATVGSPSAVRQGRSCGTGLWDAEPQVSPHPLRNWDRTGDEECKRREAREESRKKMNKGEKKKKRVDNVDSRYATYDLLIGSVREPMEFIKGQAE